MRVLDLVLEGKFLNFSFGGRQVSGTCQLETKNTLVVSGKVYPKAGIKGLTVEGRPVSKAFYSRSVEERLKRVLSN